MSFADAAANTAAALESGGASGGMVGNAAGVADVMSAMKKDANNNQSGMVQVPQMLTGMPQIAPLATPMESAPFRQRFRGYGV